MCASDGALIVCEWLKVLRNTDVGVCVKPWLNCYGCGMYVSCSISYEVDLHSYAVINNSNTKVH